jgi:hypothetical protein
MNQYYLSLCCSAPVTEFKCDRCKQDCQNNHSIVNEPEYGYYEKGIFYPYISKVADYQNYVEPKKTIRFKDDERFELSEDLNFQNQ